MAPHLNGATICRMLQFSSKWRVTPPADGTYKTAEIPKAAILEIAAVIKTMAGSAPYGEGQNVLEHFKGYFASAAGGYGGRSSSFDYAEYDLMERMEEAATNAPKFIEAFHDACETGRPAYETINVPDAEYINAVLEKFDIGYVLEPPLLKLRQGAQLVPVSTSSLLDNAHRDLRDASERAKQLLNEGRPREAVQSSLFLLESVATAFKNVGAKGSYFNEIAKHLKTEHQGKVFGRVLDWVTTLQGFLSAPKGGGVRHGMDIDHDPIEHHEAELFCNLIHSYVNFIIVEYELATKRRE
jgi:hypothetical protein